MWMFKRVGRVDIVIPKDTDNQDEVLDVAFGSGMEDFDIVDGDEPEGKQLVKVSWIFLLMPFLLFNFLTNYIVVLSTGTRRVTSNSRFCILQCRASRTQDRLYTRVFQRVFLG